MIAHSDLCHFRTHRECACPGSCQQQPTTPAPVFRATNTDIAVIWSFCTIVTAIVAFTVLVAIPRAEESLHRQALDQQEASYVAR